MRRPPTVTRMRRRSAALTTSNHELGGILLRVFHFLTVSYFSSKSAASVLALGDGHSEIMSR